jgi:hypothetical protein
VNVNFLVPNKGAFEIAPPQKKQMMLFLVNGSKAFDYISVTY